MSLLTIVQAACDELGLVRPLTVAGSSDNQVRQMMALVNRDGKRLASLPGGWQLLRQEYVWTTQPNQDAYPLPADYGYMLPQTEWDRTHRWQLMGPMSPEEWQVLKSGITPTGPRRRFRLYGGQIHIDPAPTDNSTTLVFEYISKSWAKDQNGNPQAILQADTDVAVIDEDLLTLGLKWRLLRAKGLSYDEERDTYDRQVELALGRDKTSRVLPLNARTGTHLLADANIPDTGFGA